MSWQSYVDDQMVGTGQIRSAAIIGLDGTIMASSAGYTLKPGEATAIINLFKNPANVFASGVTVAGTKFMGIKGDDRSIYGKKGATGVMLVKTGQTILLGYYDATQQPGNAANAVEKLGDYLIDNGQ